MTDWRLVQELFEETRELGRDERARRLRERSGGDAEVARRVEALVAADAGHAPVLDAGAAGLLAALRDEEPAEALCGRSVGPYRIEAHLSTGGMGHVYRAVRAQAGTERRVAMKVLRTRLVAPGGPGEPGEPGALDGLASGALLERFQRERRTLAALEHEHVVSFLDAGALPDGRPYLVMEYVEGTPLTSWGEGRSEREKLSLFLRVLAAVQYAHEQLVVHRDLKPSNVLVTAQGAPKLLDFGVASVLGTEAGDEERGGAPLTPVYASPEQLRGAPATTASDVYSLAVLLHELLTGELPGSADVALGRLSGDLAAVVRKGLALDASERYRRPDEMAADLERYLARRPVSACRGTPAHRARLFLRRNPWPVLATLAVVLATVAGWVASDLGRRRAEGEASLGWGAHAEAKLAAWAFERWILAAAAEDPALCASAVAHLEGVLRSDVRERPEAETLVRLALAELHRAGGDRAAGLRHAARARELAATTRGIGAVDRERAERLHHELASEQGRD